MASFRFLHAADIHLDSPLKGLTGHEGNAAERVRTATREALEQLVGLAIEEKVDFFLIAGDLYDGDWRDYRNGMFFVRQSGRHKEAGVLFYFFFQAEDGIRDYRVTGVQTCALPICPLWEKSNRASCSIQTPTSTS